MFTEEWPPADPGKRMLPQNLAMQGNPTASQYTYLDSNTAIMQLPQTAPPPMPGVSNSMGQYSNPQGLHQYHQNMAPNGLSQNNAYSAHNPNQGFQSYQNPSMYGSYQGMKQEPLSGPLPSHQYPSTAPENHDFSQYSYPLQAPVFWQKQAYDGYAPDGPSAVSSESLSYPRHSSTTFPDPGESTLIERLQLLLPQPPLAKAPVVPESHNCDLSKRVTRKSKFTPEQDRLILSLKRKGRSWVEIADITNLGSFLAARNRYQVIVGQQGPNNLASWTPEKKMYLQSILDAAELYKWEFIAQRLSRSTGKNFTSRACRDMVRYLLFLDPESLGVTNRTLDDLEKEIEASNKRRRQMAS